MTMEARAIVGEDKCMSTDAGLSNHVRYADLWGLCGYLFDHHPVRMHPEPPTIAARRQIYPLPRKSRKLDSADAESYRDQIDRG